VIGGGTQPNGYTPKGFSSRPAGGEVRIFGFHNNKQTNKKTNKGAEHKTRAMHCNASRR